MAWGIVNRKEVEALFEERRLEDRRKVDVAIAACNARHDLHDREREADRKAHTEHNSELRDLTEALNKTNATLARYLPNLIDAEEKAATKKQLKEGAAWWSEILKAVITSCVIIAAIAAYSNGLFVK